MNIYVGNLSREVTEEDLRQAFEVHGQVSSIAIIKDRSKGIRIRGNAHSSRGPGSDRQSERHGARGKCTQGQRGSLAPRVAEDVVAWSVSSKCRGARNVKNAESRLRRRKDW